MSKDTDLGAVYGSYADALPIPSELLRPFLALVGKWTTCSGPEWTVGRLKGVYTDFVRWMAGQEMVTSWIARNPKDDTPSGVIGGLYRYATKGKRQTFSVITLFRVYTQEVASEPLPAQMDKFLTGVNAEDQAIPPGIEEGVVAMVASLGRRLSLGPARPFWTYMPSDSKRVPCLDGRTRSESGFWMNQWHDLHLSYYGQTAMRKWRTVFHDVLGSFDPSYDSIGPHGPRIDSVGAIGLIQEPGLKLRAVANPNRVYQVALEPLGDALFSLLKGLPWDCTHEQSKAIPHIQQHLSAGKVVHCVDLTSATDFFPLRLQLSVLRALVIPGNRDYVGLFEFLSRAPWRLGKSVIRWSKGQPLGLYPSFASFALTHGLLLLFLNGGRHDDAFFVLGDDVVILDDQLHAEYMRALGELGCPTAKAKSLDSPLMAEFAGKLITQKAVFPQPKWRDMSDDNFLDVIRLLGKQALRLCRARQRRVAKLLWELPEFLGGLGFNPHGIPLETRCCSAYQLLGVDDSGVYLMSLDEQLSRFFNPETATNGILPRPQWRGDYRMPDLDQRSLALTLRHLPQFLMWYKVLGRNLFELVPGRDVLPEVGGSGRQSLLSLLERKLKLT
jgi:hypothetical protein